VASVLSRRSVVDRGYRDDTYFYSGDLDLRARLCDGDDATIVNDI
jgi:hypothetical protein